MAPDQAARGAYPVMPGRDGSTLPIERTEPRLDVVEVLDDASCGRCVNRSRRAGSAYAAPSATDGNRWNHPSNRPPSHQKLREQKLSNQRLYTLNSPPTVSSAWRSCVPEAGTPSPPSLRLAEANAPYPNP